MHRAHRWTWVWIASPVATASVVVAFLSGCGGSGGVATAPPTLPGTLQGQVGGLLTLLSPFLYNPTGNLPSSQQRSNCPTVVNNPDGSITLDFGSGCQPFPGAPTHSGSVTISFQSNTTTVQFVNFNAGGGNVINGGFVYSTASFNGFQVGGEFTATPVANGSSCSVIYSFNGTLTPTSNGYLVEGESSQIINPGPNEVRYQIVFDSVQWAQGCPYPNGGTATITPVDASSTPTGNPTVVTFGSPCGAAQVQSGGNTYSASLQNLPPFNLCATVP